jgi:uncharacterized protein (DUF885 family)
MKIKKTIAFCLAFAGLLTLSCAQEPDSLTRTLTDDPVAVALTVAQEYVDGYFDQFPEDAILWGFPDPPADRCRDLSPSALVAWREREDEWLATLQDLDPDSLDGTDAASPHALVLELLEASRDVRVCRYELWSVNASWSGWQSYIPDSFTLQAVATDKAREDILARARDVARFIDTDIANLREGLTEGYVAPRSGVEAVLRVTDGLLEGGPEASPFYEPAVRDGSEEFGTSLLSVVTDDINPAIGRYHDFLSTEYLPAARDSAAATDTPGGDACYAAAIRFYTSMSLSPEEIHETGLREMERLHEEMRAIGHRSFGIDDPKELLEHVRTNPSYRFGSEQEILDNAQAAVDRARATVPDWFGFLPKAEVVVKPYAEYLERTGGGQWIMGSPDGAVPATFKIGAHNPTSLARAEIEALTFHETYPGHHLQIMVPYEIGNVHPALQYFWVEAVGEGWALYSEKLADEMGLYSSDLSEIGRLSNEAWRAARLVIDPGMHALGWTRQQAIDYMLENTSKCEEEVIYEIDRYIANPGQAVSYMIGSLEIQRLRRLAEERLGDRFDIRAFHDAVIDDGTLPIETLRRKIEGWIESEERH